jgi:predicted PhzF superfamily epimerase YddE/YHI9
MIAVPFALYDAFSETAFGGSQAGVVSDAAKLDDETKRRINSDRRSWNCPCAGTARSL